MGFLSRVRDISHKKSCENPRHRFPHRSASRIAFQTNRFVDTLDFGMVRGRWSFVERNSFRFYEKNGNGIDSVLQGGLPSMTEVLASQALFAPILRTKRGSKWQNSLFFANVSKRARSLLCTTLRNASS